MRQISKIKLDSVYSYEPDKKKLRKPQSAVTRRKKYEQENMEGRNVARSPEEGDENKTECISFDDVSNCLSDDKP